MTDRTMLSLGQKTRGGVETFEEITTAVPEPTGHDLRVRTLAVATNPVDCKVRGRDAPVEDPPLILGYDACGIVDAVGDEVTRFKLGDRVYYSGHFRRPGCNADYALVDERITGHAPSSLSDVEAASVPLTGLTAWECLFERLLIDINNKEGNAKKTILVVAGAGGVGAFAVQLAKLAGLRVVATASREETIAFAKQRGADVVINHHKDIAEQLESNGIKGVDYLLCTNNTPAWFKIFLNVSNPFARMVTIVETNDSLPVGDLMWKNLSFTYQLMFTRAILLVEPERQGNALDELAKLLDAKTIQHNLTKTLDFGLESLREMHTLQESGKCIGKVAMKWRQTE